MLAFNDRAPAMETTSPSSTTQIVAEAVQGDQNKIPHPEISIIVDGHDVFKPGMKSIFVEADNGISIEAKGQWTGVVSSCTCNTVCTCEAVQICSCNSVCTCESHSVCSCQGYTSGGGGYSYCSCVPVH